MSLVEVTISMGIITFCAVALMGLLPVVFSTARESRESTVTARIHQTVAGMLREDFDLSTGPWLFNHEGLPVTDASEAHYRAMTNAPIPANLSGSTSSHILMVPVVIENTVRGHTSLIRPVFINHESAQTPSS